MDKTVAAERLRQIANRARSQCPRASLLVGECGEENEGNSAPHGTQAILQLNAAHTGHLNVSHYAGEVIETALLQELFRRGECMHEISERPDEAVGRGTYGFIIINDCDKRRL